MTIENTVTDLAARDSVPQAKGLKPADLEIVELEAVAIQLPEDRGEGDPEVTV